MVTLYTIAASQRDREEERGRRVRRGDERRVGERKGQRKKKRLSIDTGTLTFAPSELKEEILELPPQTKF